MEPRRNVIAVLDAGNHVLTCKDYPAFGSQTFPSIPDISGCALPQVGNQKLCLYGCVLVLDEMDQGRTKKTNWKTGSSQTERPAGSIFLPLEYSKEGDILLPFTRYRTVYQLSISLKLVLPST